MLVDWIPHLVTGSPVPAGARSPLVARRLPGGRELMAALEPLCLHRRHGCGRAFDDRRSPAGTDSSRRAGFAASRRIQRRCLPGHRPRVGALAAVKPRVQLAAGRTIVGAIYQLFALEALLQKAFTDGASNGGVDWTRGDVSRGPKSADLFDCASPTAPRAARLPVAGHVRSRPKRDGAVVWTRTPTSSSASRGRVTKVIISRQTSLRMGTGAGEVRPTCVLYWRTTTSSHRDGHAGVGGAGDHAGAGGDDAPPMGRDTGVYPLAVGREGG